MSSILLFLINCAKDSHSENNKDKKDEAAVPVEAATVGLGEISAYFSGTTTLEAEEETEVVAKIGGVVKKLLAEEGDDVSAGQVLAKLDDEKVAVQLAQARANYQKLENEYNRSQSLMEKKLISTEEYQRIQYEFENQKAAYELAQLELDYTAIKAPISGVIAERLIKVGNMVLLNQATFKITSHNPLIAALHVPERQMSNLKVGHPARFKVDALARREFKGVIKRVSPVVDPTTGTVKVTVEVNNADKALKPGMFARINIIYDVHSNTMLVPKDALISEDNESAVYVVRDSLVFRQTVKTGYINTSHIEVISGVVPGDTIVTTGKGSLKDSAKVEIIGGETAKLTVK